MRNLRLKCMVTILHSESYRKKNNEEGYKIVVLFDGGDSQTLYVSEPFEIGPQEVLLTAGVSKNTDKNGNSTPTDQLYLKIFKIKSE